MGEEQFYVYVNYHCVTGSPIYVGKGKGDRWKPSEHRDSKAWRNYFLKHGFEGTKTTVLECESEEQAFQWEKELIYLLRCDGVSLYNMTDGGEGISGCERSDECRRKISVAKRGKGFSIEHRKNLGEAKRGVSCSEESRRIRSAALK